MSRILEEYIVLNIAPVIEARKVKLLAQAQGRLPQLLLAGADTASAQKDIAKIGDEFDELLYQIIIPAVARAVHQYIETNVRVVPGQTVITDPGQVVQVSPATGTGATAAPGTGRTSTPGILTAD